MKTLAGRTIVRPMALAVLLLCGNIAPSLANPAIGDGSFQGEWDLTTSQNGSFVLTLIPFEQADGTIVSGRFDNANPNYSGTLSGYLYNNGTAFSYNVKQPKMGLVGKGIFKMSRDGKSISGSVNFWPADLSNKPVIHMTWWGPRR